VVRIGEIKKRNLPFPVLSFLFPLDSMVCEYGFKVLGFHYKEAWDKRTIKLY
jgi:hypothetical protein